MTPEDRQQFISEVAEAMRIASPQLSADEQIWVRMAIQKEAQAIELRKAIIEKTLGSLIWSAIAGIGYLFIDYLKNHGLRV